VWITDVAGASPRVDLDHLSCLSYCAGRGDLGRGRPSVDVEWPVGEGGGMVDPSWLVICLSIVTGNPADPPEPAEVVAAGLDVFVLPDVSSFSTGRLRTGDRVTAYRTVNGEWMEIDPPNGAISWIDRDDLSEGVDGRFQVISEKAVVRPGRPGAKFPGPPRSYLRRGATVQPVEVTPLVVRQGSSNRTWIAIHPPRGERRFVKSNGLQTLGTGADMFAPTAPDVRTITRRTVSPLPAIDPTIAAVSPSGAPLALAPELSNELSRIEDRHRQILRQPPEYWQLAPVRADYQSLLGRVSDTSSQTALSGRIHHVERQIVFSQAARSLDTLLQSSRSRDRQVAALDRPLAQPNAPTDDPYDAEGILQSSSKESEGQRLQVLIGPDGNPAAYLRIPPGLSTKPYNVRRVGVRGTVHYDETLRSRLIDVQDLEPIGGRP
jgi:hypothetical protein